MAITNHVRNPSTETNATSWQGTTTGASVARSTSEFLYGVASLAVTCTGALSLQGGLYATQHAAAVQGEVWSGGVYAKGSGIVTFELRERNAAGSALTSTIVGPLTLGSSWTQYKKENYTIQNASTAFITMVMLTNSAQAVTFYMDGAMLVKEAALPSYFDGSFPNCRWTGTAHASTSIYTPPAAGGVMTLDHPSIGPLKVGRGELL